MINLLPPEISCELRAARWNSILRKYLITSIAALMLILFVFSGSFYLNYTNQQDYAKERALSEQKLAQSKDVRERAKEYNDNLKVAQQVLSSEVRLSELLKELSGTLPPGSVLNDVSLDLQSIVEPISITAQIDSFEKAAVLKRNFEESDIFETVTLSSVMGVGGAKIGGGTDAGQDEDGNEPTQQPEYAFTATLEVSLSAEATKNGSGTARTQSKNAAP